jgi:FMN-dependent NADH-azoreductase
MKQILIIFVSPKGSDSASRKVAQNLSARLEARYPGAKIVHRDLAKDKIPHLDYGIMSFVNSPVLCP